MAPIKFLSLLCVLSLLPFITAAGLCVGEKWDSSTQYCAGDQVHFKGRQYTAKWCTYDDPSQNDGEFDAWVNNGNCVEGRVCQGSSWDSKTQYYEGDKVYENNVQYTAKWGTIGKAPSTHHGKYEDWTWGGPCAPLTRARRRPMNMKSRGKRSVTMSVCVGDEWDSSKQYCEGEKVYQYDKQYTSKWCNIGLVPRQNDGEFDAWEDNGRCAEGGICEGPAWDSDEQYCIEEKVYRNNVQYKAKWCNRNEDPSEYHDPFDVWIKLASCVPPTNTRRREVPGRPGMQNCKA